MVHCSVFSLPNLLIQELQLAANEYDTYTEDNRNRPSRRERAGNRRLKKSNKRGGLRKCGIAHFGIFLD